MQRWLQSSMVVRLLLAAVLGAGLARQAAGEGRRLAQAATSAEGTSAATAAVPQRPPSPQASGAEQSPYGSPAVDACVQLTNNAGQSCTVESDTISLVYPRGSDRAPTPEESDTAILDMKYAAQPSGTCCDNFRPFADARCPCDAAFQQLLPIGGYVPVYFEGITGILATACAFEFPPCQPGETIKLNNTGSGTGG